MPSVACFRSLIAVVGVLLSFTLAVPAQNKKAEPTIGELIVQEIPARHYVYGSFETEFKSMGKPVGETLGDLIKTTSENKRPIVGPVLHFYYGAPHTAPEKGFKMETGFFVAPGSKGIGDFKVRELPKYRCASILYVGPGASIGDAWRKLYKSAQEKNLTPTDEERELYLYFEGIDSPNNIVQVMVGVK